MLHSQRQVLILSSHLARKDLQGLLEYVAEQRLKAERLQFKHEQWRLHGAAMNIIQEATSQDTLEAWAKAIQVKFCRHTLSSLRPDAVLMNSTMDLSTYQ